MNVVWTRDLSVGIQEIDWQHQELFHHINGFLDSLQPAPSGDSLAERFDLLEKYVNEHFSAEEGYMNGQLAGYYPDREARRHRGEHETFIRDYREYLTEIMASGLTVQRADEFRSWMRNWWFMHVSGTDRRLGSALRARYPFIK